jgi:hypothetical protein
MDETTAAVLRVVFSPLVFVFGFLFVILLSLAIGVPVWVYRRLTRYRYRVRDRAAHAVLERLRRQELAPVEFYLLLRPFVFYHRDGVVLAWRKRGRNRYGQRTGTLIERLLEALIGSPEDHVEEAIARGFHRDHSPLVALGPSRNLGGGKLQLPDEEWRTAASLLIRHARRIILIPSYHAGTLWEIEHILAVGALAKTVWVMPPFLRRHDEEEWGELARSLRALGLELPPYVRRKTLDFFTVEQRDTLAQGVAPR